MMRPRLLLRLAVVTVLLLCVFTEDAHKGEKHTFQAEVQKMLDIIIRSLYTNRQIFLREVISNASDALDKIRLLYLTDPKDPKNDKGDSPTLDIRISADKDARTLTIADGGIGMTKEDLINHLGSIGASGTKKFVEKMQDGADVNMIGQFGVGFYSVFLVADNVKVASKHDDDTKQWVWESTADGNFFIYEDPRGNTIGRGTEVTLELKKDADEMMDPQKLKDIVKTYSEFIHFPIYVQTSKTEKVAKEKPAEPVDENKDEDAKDDDEKDEKEDKAAEEETEEVTTFNWDLVNEQKPIWTRKTADITTEEYNNFYKAVAKDSTDPLWYTHFNAEGEVEFKSILYIPGKAPSNLFDASMGALNNIRLYVRRVFITDEFKDLLPRYLNFIRGVVDSDDLPLNVSRELLQENRILKIIKKKLIRKALAMIKEIAEEDEKHKDEKPEDKSEEDKKDEAADDDNKDEKKYEPKYPKFWEEFGKNIRLGLIEDSANRARLTKLLRYKSSKSDNKLISLEEYVERMPDEQKNIFYLVGASAEQIETSPLLERAKKVGVEVLYMTDAIDEYVVAHITEFSGKKLANLAKAGVKITDESERDKKIDEKRKESWKPFLDWWKNILGSSVEKVVLSKRLTDAPCVVVSPEYGITATMARIMKAQALADNTHAQEAKRILEINHLHPVVDELRRRSKENEEDPITKETATLLYEVAALQSGFELDDTKAFSARMHKVMKQGLNLDLEAGLVEEEEYDIADDADADDDDEKSSEKAEKDDDVVQDEL